MSDTVRKRGFLLGLAAEAIAPALTGAAGPWAGRRAIDRFGPLIVDRWREWLRNQSPAVQKTVLAELADLPADRARAEALSAVDRLAPAATPEDRAAGMEYVAALPRAAQRALVLDHSTGGRALPRHQSLTDPATLLSLLPLDVPPYPPHSAVPDTKLKLGELLGFSGLGPVYRAAASSAPFVLEFCIDNTLAELLRSRREELERAIESGRGEWSERLVRLLDANLDHATPYLAWEHVPAGDLSGLLNNLREQTGRGLVPDDVRDLVAQIAEGLAFAHERGLAHGDLKPASVLVSGDAVKLAAFGVGAVVADHAVSHSRLGHVPSEELSPTDRVRQLRGAGSLLYLEPERRDGGTAEPNGDVYSLGVVWYQLLVGDVSRPLPPDFARSLREEGRVPADQLTILEKCLTARDGRPADARALLDLLRPRSGGDSHAFASSEVSPEEMRLARMRREELITTLRMLRDDLRELKRRDKAARRVSPARVLLASFTAAGLFAAAYFFTDLRVWSLVPALVGFAAVLLVLVRGAVRKIKKARQEMRQRIERLVEAYPDDLQAWGGPRALGNIDVLTELIPALEADLPPPPDAAPPGD